MKRLLITLVFAISIVFFTNAQNTVSIGTTSTNKDAVLWLSSPGKNQGLIIPVVSNKTAVPGVAGMVVFDDSDKKIYYNDGANWVGPIGTGSGATGAAYKLQLNATTKLLELMANGTVQDQVAIVVAGDLTGTANAATVSGIQGRVISATAPTDQQILKWNATNNQWEPATIAGGTGDITDIVAGTGLTGGATTGSATLNVDVGTTANKIIQLDGTGKLPAIDGSQLTNLPAGPGDISGVVAGTGLTGGATTGDATLNVDVGTTANKIVQLDGTGKLPAVDGSLLTNLPVQVETGDISSVTAGTGLTGGAATGDATLNVDVGTTANKIVQLDGTGKLPAIDGSQLTNLPAGVIADGSITGGTGAGAKIAATTITDANISSGANISATKLAGTIVLDTEAPNVAGDLSGDFSTGLQIKSNTVTTTEITNATITGADLAGNIAISTTAGITAATFTGNGAALTGITTSDGSITGGTAGAGVKIAANTITDANLNKSNIALSGFGIPIADLNLGARKITNLATPTVGTDATTKTYVDAADATKLNTNTLTTGGDLLYNDGTSTTRLPRGTNGQILQSTASGIQWAPAGASGEVNSASNVGVGGTGVFKQKTGADLELRNINAASNKINVALDGINNEIDLDVNEANLSITSGQVTGLGALATLAEVGGGLGGTITDGTINGADIATMGAINGDVLTFNGGIWAPATLGGGGNMVSTNNLSDVANVTTARTNLGLGSLATLSTITSTEITDASIAGTDLAGNIAISTTGGITAATFTGDGSALTGISATVGDGTITGGTAGAGVKLAANTITDANINSLDAAKITSGTLPIARIAAGAVDNTKLATGIDAAKITTGTLPTAQVPNLDAAKITSGTFSVGNFGATNLSTTGTISATSFIGSGAALTGITPADGSITGGTAGAGVKIAATTITDANINAAAAIAGTKVSPSFGTQNISTTGTIQTAQFIGNTTLTNDAPVTMHNTATTGTSNGVYGETDSPAGAGVFGISLQGGTGVNGFSNTGFGTSGFSTSGIGVYGQSGASAAGTYGFNTATGPGVVGRASGTAQAGVHGFNDILGGYGILGSSINGNAGYFNGSVVITGALGLSSTPNYGTSGQVLTSAGPGVVPTWSSGTGWGLTGNALTVDGTNFIGTTDNIPFNLKANNQKAGRIETAAGTANTFYGYQSGNVNTGTLNTAMGYLSLFSNTTGGSNTAAGRTALAFNTTGSNNTGSGVSALGSNTTGGNNTANGFNAGYSNTTGQFNTASGAFALFNNLAAQGNTAIGSNALFDNVAGSNATAVGANAMLYSNNTATPFSNTNVAVGFEALRGSTTPSANTGSDNAALGFQALFNNSSGTGNNAFGTLALTANTTGSFNVAQGQQALWINDTGGQNTASGYQSLASNVAGNNNTSYGFSSLVLSTGNFNTATGAFSLNSNTTGNQNTAIGYFADVAVGGLTKSTAIGYNAKVATSSSMVLGGTGVDAVNVGVNTTSPTERLDIVGNVKFSGALMPNNLAGTSGQVLTSAGAGLVPTWTTIAGGGNMISTNNLSDVANVGTARTNLGLGSLATLSTITSTEISDGTITGLDLSPNIAISTTGNITANTFTGNGSALTGITATPADGSITGGTAGAGVKLAANTITDANINSLDAAKITSGTLPIARIAAGAVDNTKLATGIDAAKITTGTLPTAQVPNLDAAKITTGILPISVGGTGAITAPTALANLGGLGTALPDGNIFVGNGSNIATGVAMGGDAIISNAGAVTLANSAGTRTNLGLGSLATLSTIGTAEISDGTVSTNDILDGTIANIDIASVDASKITTGTLTTARGGTGITSVTPGGVAYGGATDFAFTPVGTTGQLLQSNGAAAPTWVNASGWGLTGNAGTLDGTNFIGTTDNVPLNFRVNGEKAGRIERLGLGGVFLGWEAGNVNAGNGNTGIGLRALSANTSGQNNTANGSYALSANTTGQGNSAFGGAAMNSNTTGTNNTAVGNGALFSNLIGIHNSALGNGTLFQNIADDNSAVGFSALTFNTTGTFNVGIGSGALNLNTTGSANTASGYQALTTNTTGNNNTAIGYAADVTSNNLTNATAIGYNAKVALSNSMVLGGTGGDAVNVGIGTTSPHAPLQFASNLANRKIVLWEGSDNDHEFDGFGINNFSLRYQTDSPGADHIFYSAINSTSSLELMRIKGNGNVGIGTGAAASEKLDVAGNVKFSGALMPNNLPGTAGQVLTSAGPGVAPTWSSSSGWGLTGNALTVDGTNFIGTIDNVPLNFRMFNQKAGRIATSVTTFGLEAGNSNTSGTNNTAIGSSALKDNTAGADNTAVGFKALEVSGTSGSHNTAVGSYALNNSSGSAPNDNTAVGFESLYFNRASNNAAVGAQALRTNTTGSSNSAFGSGALFNNLGGFNNVAMGTNSLNNNSAGNDNVAIGVNALVNSLSNSNTAIGSGAGNALQSGVRNTFIGAESNAGNIFLSDATAIGYKAFVTTNNSMVLGAINGVNGATNDTNVGIGTTAPSAKLDIVGGNIKITDGTQGVGKVLTSDASGLASWQNAGGYSTANSIPKGNGSGLTGSMLTDDGTTVTVNQVAGTTDPLLAVINGHALGDGSIRFTGGATHYSIGADNSANAFVISNSAFGLGTSDRFVINSSGNVGIGVTNPVTGLDVFSNNGIRLNSYLGAGSTASGSAYLGANLYQGYANSFWYWANTHGSVGGAAIGLNSSSASNSIQFFRAAGASTADALAGTLQESMRIDASGNVGIGTPFPNGFGGKMLHLSGTGNTAYILEKTDAVARKWAMVTGGGGEFIIQDRTASVNAFFMEPGVTSSQLYLRSGGNVGIGTSTPGVPLDISSPNTAIFLSGGSTSFNSLNGPSLSNGNPTPDVSIRATGAFLSTGSGTSGGFYVTSDERIKRKVGVSDSKNDLSTLMKLKITDYKFVDSLNAGNIQVKGVFAQEVESVYPQAISKQTNWIPNIYAVADGLTFDEAKQTLSITMAKAHGLNVGDKVKLISSTSSEKPSTVISVEGNSFTVADWTENTEKIFVYGKEVKDFRIVDYDRLYTLGISAIQELNKKLEAQQLVIDSLQAQDAESKKKIAALEASLVDITSTTAQTETTSAPATQAEEIADLKKQMEEIKKMLSMEAKKE